MNSQEKLLPSMYMSGFIGKNILVNRYRTTCGKKHKWHCIFKGLLNLYYSRGAFGCADKLVMDEKTNGYVLYAMRLIDLLLHYNVKPILVFDGRNLPSKARTEAKRRENRANYRKMVS